MSCGSPWMAVSKELTQIITAQTARCSAVGMAAGRTVPAQNRLHQHRTCRGRLREPLTSHRSETQSLELQPFPLEVLPSLIPWHVELPTIPRAANGSVLFWAGPVLGSSLDAQSDKQAAPVPAGSAPVPAADVFLL